MIDIEPLASKPWHRGRRGDFTKHAKKPSLTNRDEWDWSLSNCALGKIHGMSPQAVRKTRIKLGKETFRNPKKIKPPYRLWTGMHAPVAMTTDLGVGLSDHGRKPRPWQERFWEKVRKGEPDQCWEWQGTRGPKGYGQLFIGTIGISRKCHKAHRLAYLIEHGEIPAGYVIRHKCDNPPCCNPNHLEIGLQAENVLDAVERLQMNCGEKNGNSKFSDEQIRAMRALKKQGYANTDIAKEFNTTANTVCLITMNRVWRHVK